MANKPHHNTGNQHAKKHHSPTEQVNMRLPADLVAKCKAAAKKQGVSHTQWQMAAAMAYLKQSGLMQ